MGSAQSALPGRLSPPLPLVLPVRPPHAYAAWPRCESLAQPLGWAFLAGKSSTAARRCPRLPSADAPIPGGPSRWALPPLSNPGCGRSRLRSGFGLSDPSQRVRDWEGGAWATMLKAADCSGPWRETRDRGRGKDSEPCLAGSQDKEGKKPRPILHSFNKLVLGTSYVVGTVY